jgi:hypothetical protein
MSQEDALFEIGDLLDHPASSLTARDKVKETADES